MEKADAKPRAPAITVEMRLPVRASDLLVHGIEFLGEPDPRLVLKKSLCLSTENKVLSASEMAFCVVRCLSVWLWEHRVIPQILFF